MTDTPEHIYKIQLEGWLKKTPAERLHQALVDNEQLYNFWRNAKPSVNKSEKVIITKAMFNKEL